MIIGIDGNEANVAKRVGIGEYSFELLRQFREFKTQHIMFSIYLKDKPRPDMPKEGENWKYTITGPKRFWTQIGLPLYLFTHFPRPNVFFTPSHYAPRFSPIPTIVSIMDLSYIHFPQLFKKNDLYQLRRWTRYSAKNAAKILTISNASRDDILKEYKKNEKDVIVTHLGIKKVESEKLKMQNMDEIKSKFGIGGKYILFVGTLQPRKNIVRLIEAFSFVVDSERGPVSGFPPANAPSATSSKEVRVVGNPSTSAIPPRPNLQLVIVGKKGWQYEEILAAPKKYDVEDKVFFLDFVTDEDLPSLYKHAEVFVLPSLYEGFGLPVLEAMKYGCPVITSNVSSLPEAGGDAALYIDPQSTQDIADTIEQVITDKKLRERMIEKGYEQCKRFSWEKTARETLEILEEVATPKKL